MSEARPHLWMTREEPRRFFLVPDDVQLARGELGVRDLQLATREVDELAIVTFEVDVEAAQAHVDAGWGRIVGRVRDTWRELLGQPDLDGPPDLSAWLGVSPGQAVLDRDKRRAGRRSLLEKAGSLFGGIDVDRAEATLDRLGDAIKRDASKVRRDLGRFGEELDARSPDIERTVEEAGEALLDLGKQAAASLRPPRREPEGEE